MKGNEEQDFTSDEKRRNMIAGLGIGVALGVVFWSALNGLLPAPFNFIIGMSTGLIAGYSIGKRPVMLMRYPLFVVRRLLLAGAAFVLGMLAYSYFLDLELNGALQILPSLLAIVPAILFIFAIGSAIGHLDEMQRRIQTEAIAIAFAGTAIVVIAVFLLGLSDVPTPNWGWLLVVMTFSWLLGKLWTMWRYR
ncbi:MAG: hypothetical protein P8Z00_13630 [Anaerolineales bacterium]|jgi:hypothetical protein